MRLLSAGRYESISRRVGECFGLSAYLDIRDHTEPDTALTLENWLSIDGGKTWHLSGNCGRYRGEENYDRFDGKRVECVIYQGGFNASREISGRFYKNVSIVQDPLVKTVLHVRGKPVRADFGLVDISGRSQSMQEAHRSIAVINSTFAFANATGFASTSTLFTTTAGSLLVSTLGNYEGAAIFDRIEDSYASTWVNSIPQTDIDADINIRQYYAASGSRGTEHVISHVATSASYPSIVVIEVMDHAASPLDQTDTYVDPFPTTSRSAGPTATTSQANELLIGAGTGTGATTVFTGTSGWTNVTVGVDFGGPTRQAMLVEYKNVTSADAYTWDMTTDSSQSAGALISTWKDINAGGGGGSSAKPAYYYARKRA